MNPRVVAFVLYAICVADTEHTQTSYEEFCLYCECHNIKRGDIFRDFSLFFDTLYPNYIESIAYKEVGG